MSSSKLLTTLLLLATQVASLAQPEPVFTPTDLSQLSAARVSQFSTFTLCSELLETCQPTIASCASSLCSLCTHLGQTGINECCSQGPAPTSCFLSMLSSVGGNVYPKNSSPPPAPQNTAPYGGVLSNSGFRACETVTAYSSACESFTSGFDQLTAFEFQAPCLCYAGTSWVPDVYDGYVSQCDAYLSLTAGPASTPCRAVGNVIAALSTYDSGHGLTAPTMTSPSTSSASTVTPTSSAVTQNMAWAVARPIHITVLITLTVIVVGTG